jgi:hypothetical protein
MATRNSIGRDPKTDGDFDAADLDIERHLVFLIVALVAEDQHSQRFERETPYHAEGVSFTQQQYVAAAGNDGGDLQ